jgi:hypothetical protein
MLARTAIDRASLLLPSRSAAAVTVTELNVFVPLLL